MDAELFELGSRGNVEELKTFFLEHGGWVYWSKLDDILCGYYWYGPYCPDFLECWLDNYRGVPKQLQSLLMDLVRRGVQRSISETGGTTRYFRVEILDFFYENNCLDLDDALTIINILSNYSSF